MIVEHLEKYLGEIQGGFSLNDSKNKLQVVAFNNQPFEGVNTLSTLGLSKYPLTIHRNASKERKIRIEMIFSASQGFEIEEMGEFLLSLADFIVNQDRGPIRGELIGPYEPLFTQTKMSAVYFSLPAFFEEEFWELEQSKETIIMVWAIPVYTKEAEFINSHGWGHFEEMLQEGDYSNFWDLERPAFPFVH